MSKSPSSTKRPNALQVKEAALAKPPATVGVAFTRPQIERVMFQVNASLAFATVAERQEAIDECFIFQNDLDGIDFRWHPEFVAKCTDTNLARFLLASVSSNERISEDEIMAATKH